ncbi:hypothetical protein JCM18899A_28730 [Nocardioides sp. AN3]
MSVARTRGREDAWLCLDVVLRNVDSGPEPPPHVWGAWVPNADTICIVFERDDAPGLLGLRRTLDPGVPPEAQGLHIAICELGEPLGSLEDELLADPDGVLWFQGDHPGWRDYSPFLPR